MWWRHIDLTFHIRLRSLTSAKIIFTWTVLDSQLNYPLSYLQLYFHFWFGIFVLRRAWATLCLPKTLCITERAWHARGWHRTSCPARCLLSPSRYKGVAPSEGMCRTSSRQDMKLIMTQYHLQVSVPVVGFWLDVMSQFSAVCLYFHA